MWLAGLARFLEYAGAAGLFGGALLYLMLLPSKGKASASQLGWPKPLLIGSSLLLLVGTLLSLAAQTATMNGINIDKLDVASLAIVLTDTRWGHAISARIVLSLVAVLIVNLGQPSRGLWKITCVLSVILLSSFAWTGHGASTPGTGGLVHLVADIAHVIAAGLWLGALGAFLALLFSAGSQDLDQQAALLNALKTFSGIGSALVATLIVSGLINSYFLIGISHVPELLASPYSRLLVIKLILFGMMLGLAAWNRFRLTPALATALENGQALHQTLGDLRRSLVLESLAGAAVLALVGVIGMMEPPTAQ